MDREEEDETLLGEFNALRVDVLNTGKIFKTSTLKTLDCMQDLQGKNLEMKEEIARLETANAFTAVRHRKLPSSK